MKGIPAATSLARAGQAPVKLRFNPLTIQLVTIVAAGAVIVWVTLLANKTTDERSDKSLNAANIAYAAAEVDVQRQTLQLAFERLINSQTLDIVPALDAYENSQALV